MLVTLESHGDRQEILNHSLANNNSSGESVRGLFNVNNPLRKGYNLEVKCRNLQQKLLTTQTTAKNVFMKIIFGE